MKGKNRVLDHTKSKRWLDRELKKQKTEHHNKAEVTQIDTAYGSITVNTKEKKNDN